MTDIEIGEHKIQKQWLNENMKEIYKIKKGKQKKKFDIDDKQIEEWNDKWYEYNDQQKLIQYIKDAQAKIKGLKKREKKEKEGDEKGEKGEKGEKKEEDNLKIIQYTPNENEIKLKQYNDLKDYFISLLPKEQKEQITIDVTGKSNYDVSKDIKAGKLKKIEKKIR